MNGWRLQNATIILKDEDIDLILEQAESTHLKEKLGRQLEDIIETYGRLIKRGAVPCFMDLDAVKSGMLTRMHYTSKEEMEVMHLCQLVLVRTKYILGPEKDLVKLVKLLGDLPPVEISYEEEYDLPFDFSDIEEF